MSVVLFFESNLGLVASRLRSAQNEIAFLEKCDLRDTSSMLFAQQELRQAQAQHSYFVQRLSNALSDVSEEERLCLCNHAHAIGFSLSA